MPRQPQRQRLLQLFCCCLLALLLLATPAIAQEARQWSSIISLVSAGMGVSLAPQSIQSLLPKAVRFVPIPRANTTVRIIGRKTGAANPAIENFLQICRTATPTPS